MSTKINKIKKCIKSMQNKVVEVTKDHYTLDNGDVYEHQLEIDENIKDIISDDGAINRIFSNLITNMIKHGESFVKITLRQENDVIITEFINKATRLTEENVDKLFDRFYTVDNSRSDKNTGLGLYITRIIVEKLGHSISSKIDNGYLKIEIIWNKNVSLM